MKVPWLFEEEGSRTPCQILNRVGWSRVADGARSRTGTAVRGGGEEDARLMFMSIRARVACSNLGEVRGVQVGLSDIGRTC